MLDIGFRCVLGEDFCDTSRDLATARKFDEALQLAERSLAMSPNYPTALYNAGVALEQLGKTSQAADRYQRLVDVWPTDHSTQNKLAQCRVKLGQLLKAIEAQHAAIDVKPDNVDYWFNKATILRQLGERILASSATRTFPEILSLSILAGPPQMSSWPTKHWRPKPWVA